MNFSESDSFYAVVLKSENKVIGKIFFNDEKRFDTYELGYTFNAAYQGKGYAKESSAAMIKYAFEEMGVRRIAAFADTTNSRSWNMLEKLGMRREGCFIKKSFKFSDESGNPIWKDMFAYAILNEEFSAK